jgi:hypothetical protein
VKVANLSTDAVVRERVLNLVSNVAIDEPKPEKKQDQQNERKSTDAHNQGR